MWNLILVYLEILLVSVQDRFMVCAEHTMSSKIVLNTPDRNTLVTWVMWNLILIHLETVLVSVQDRCMVCTKRTTCLEIVLDASGCSFWSVWR
jgi:hypothetical protein